VNLHTTGYQQVPVIDTGREGEVIVAWSGSDQDGSGDGIFGRKLCTDIDTDGICDGEDIFVFSHVDGDRLDCRDPAVTRPLIEWEMGGYDRFRVFIAADPSFAKGTHITSGDQLLEKASWMPGRKKWSRACALAESRNPANPLLYIRVKGIDRDLPKRDPNRKGFSQVVEVNVLTAVPSVIPHRPRPGPGDRWNPG
jgi:hypothetical protein